MYRNGKRFPSLFQVDESNSCKKRLDIDMDLWEKVNEERKKVNDHLSIAKVKYYNISHLIFHTHITHLI